MRIAPVVICALFAACAGTSPAPSNEAQEPKTAPAPSAAQAAEPNEEQRKGWQKELRQKQRELEYARAELPAGDLERQSRLLGAENGVHKAELAKDKAQKALALFLEQEKPAALAERQLNLDQMTYRAEESKDELAELEAMYNKDEFAKTTKELVLKRSRRQLEVSDRRLKLARDEQLLETQHRLPARERDLQNELHDAEFGLKRAAMELQKARLEAELAVRKAQDRMADLERDIAELQQKLEPKS